MNERHYEAALSIADHVTSAADDYWRSGDAEAFGRELRRIALELDTLSVHVRQQTRPTATAGEGETTSEQGRSQPGVRDSEDTGIKRVSTTVAANRKGEG